MHDSHCGCPECWWAKHGSPRSWHGEPTPPALPGYEVHDCVKDGCLAQATPAGASSAPEPAWESWEYGAPIAMDEPKPDIKLSEYKGDSRSMRDPPRSEDVFLGPTQAERDPLDIELEHLRKLKRERDEAFAFQRKFPETSLKVDDPSKLDPWKHRSAGMKCKSCMWFVPKLRENVATYDFGRCRRHAPTMGGFPVVYVNDWCGDHRIDETKL